MICCLLCSTQMEVIRSNKRASSSVLKIRDCETITPAVDSPDRESAHLKLTQQYDISHDNQDTLEQNSKILLEYAFVGNSSTILSSMGGNLTKLEMFGIMMLKKNLTEEEGVLIREVG